MEDSSNTTGSEPTNWSNFQQLGNRSQNSSVILSLRNLMLFALYPTIIVVLFIFLTLGALHYIRNKFATDSTGRAGLHSKKRAQRPPPLSLHIDLELASRQPQDRNPFDPSPALTSSSTPADNDSAIASGISLAPFTPLRERTRRWAFDVADAELEKKDEEDSLGLDRYFFSDGVGIKRYESGAKERRCKDA